MTSFPRSGFDMSSRTLTSFHNATGALYLVVRNVTAADSGEFACVADNGIGNEDKNNTFLLVRGEKKKMIMAQSKEQRVDLARNSLQTS